MDKPNENNTSNGTQNQIYQQASNTRPADNSTLSPQIKINDTRNS